MGRTSLSEARRNANVSFGRWLPDTCIDSFDKQLQVEGKMLLSKYRF